jgi:hypothetical protein
VNGLALYAAAVGTASLGWTIWREVRSERSDVRVTVMTEPVPIGEGKYELTVVTRNHGKTDEVVERIGLNFLDPTVDEMGRGAAQERVDEPLPPRRNVRWTWNLGTQRFKVGREYQGYAVLASGVTELSEWFEFSADTLRVAGLEDLVLEARSTKR